ncbi:MAG: hypothetical protein ACKOPM_15345 [Novosphingobium sp.]
MPSSADRFRRIAAMTPRELTIRSVVLGGLLTFLFTAANVYF